MQICDRFEPVQRHTRDKVKIIRLSQNTCPLSFTIWAKLHVMASLTWPEMVTREDKHPPKNIHLFRWVPSHCNASSILRWNIPLTTISMTSLPIKCRMLLKYLTIFGTSLLMKLKCNIWDCREFEVFCWDSKSN